MRRKTLFVTTRPRLFVGSNYTCRSSIISNATFSMFFKVKRCTRARVSNTPLTARERFQCGPRTSTNIKILKKYVEMFYWFLTKNSKLKSFHFFNAARKTFFQTSCDPRVNFSLRPLFWRERHLSGKTSKFENYLVRIFIFEKWFEKKFGQVQKFDRPTLSTRLGASNTT